MHRRKFLGGATAAFISGCSDAPSGSTSSSSATSFQSIVNEFADQGKLDVSLAQVRAERGIEIGCSIPWQFRGRASAGRFGETLSREFSIACPENDLQWDQRRHLAATRADIRFLRSRGKKVRGHAIYFYQNIPASVAQAANDPGVSAGRLGDRIYKEMFDRVRRWGSNVSYWVINETAEHPARTGLRLDPVTRKLGYDFFRIAVSAVKDAAPGMQVELNDFVVERGNDAGVRHLLQVGEHLDKHGLRYDRVGFQCHIDWQGGRKDFSLGSVVSAARRLSGTGVNFAITEIDVDDRNFRGDEAERRVFVAKEYFNALSRLSSISRLVEVSTWSAFDTSNWIRRGDKDRGRFANSNVSRTGWFDDNYQRTLAYYASCRALLTR